MESKEKGRWKYRWLIVSLGILVSLVVACTDENPEIGSEFFDDVSFELQSWDTLTVNFSTLKMDSVSTSSPSRLLVGQVDQQYLGTITAASFFQVGSLGNADYPTGSDYTFTEATLTLYYDGYQYGDTTYLMEISVQELIEDLEPEENEEGETTDLFNFSEFEVEEGFLGSVEFHPQPYSGDSIVIDLKFDRFQDLFEFLDEDDLDAKKFKEELKGFRLISNSNGAIIGFQPELALRLYYQDHTDEDPEEQIIEFGIQSGDYFFNQISADQSATDLTMERDESLESSDTNHKMYLQAGMGLAMKIEVPYIRELLARDDELLIEKVELELPILNNIPEENYMLQDLVISRIDEDNDILKTYSSTVTLDVSSEFGFDRKYTIDITDFIEEQLVTNIAPNEDGLLLRFEDEVYRNTLNHLIVPDSEGEDEQSKIKLNVIRIKQ